MPHAEMTGRSRRPTGSSLPPSAVLVRPDGAIGSPVLGGRGWHKRPPGARGGGARPAAEGSWGPTGDVARPRRFRRRSDTNRNGRTRGRRSGPSIRVARPRRGKRRPHDTSRGEKVVVLFWDPECGHCRQDAPALKAWENNPPKEAPKLLVSIDRRAGGQQGDGPKLAGGAR